jgi:hypothetical protein
VGFGVAGTTTAGGGAEAAGGTDEVATGGGAIPSLVRIPPTSVLARFGSRCPVRR